MAKEKATSGATGAEQETIAAALGQGDATASGTDTGPVQEQSPGAKHEQEIDFDERVRREVQSRVDRARADERRRVEETLRREAEQRAWEARLEEMTDEELGAMVRENRRVQGEMQRQQAQVLARTYQQIQEETLALVPPEEREGLAARANAGEFQSYGEFLAAATEARLKGVSGKERAKLEREIREAAQNEAAAKIANYGPQLGAGLPTQTLDVNQMDSGALIRAGLKDLFKE